MNKQLDLRVKDNFLNIRDFMYLKELFFHHNTTWQANWQIGDGLEVSKKDNYDDWFLCHGIYRDSEPVSSAFNDVRTKLVDKIAQLEQADFAALTRIKANFYPHTSVVQEHLPHKDSMSARRWRGAIYCLNTCDGYTGFADGTKVESVENRLILFDSLQEHFSTSTSNAQARLNINVNYV